MKSLIFLVDENRNQLSALERAISSVEEFELAGMTSDGEECIRQLDVYKRQVPNSCFFAHLFFKKSILYRLSLIHI